MWQVGVTHAEASLATLRAILVVKRADDLGEEELVGAMISPTVAVAYLIVEIGDGEGAGEVRLGRHGRQRLDGGLQAPRPVTTG